ncbi:MAG: hypothetical protein Q9162_003442 [Coniocarpon cinnabarinum]
MLDIAPLGSLLRSLPHEKKYRYTSDVRQHLVRALFYSLAGHKQQHLDLLFPHGTPTWDQEWKLSEARGTSDGAEYTEAARGKRCGHIFKHEEATYFCRTCTTDATCVLCQKCFEASDHEGHHVEVYLSEGSSGCCDCGDDEAWSTPLKCGIHTSLDETGRNDTNRNTAEHSLLPLELQESIRLTIAKVFDYLCDVFSCAPEHMKAPKRIESIQQDEHLARLVADWYDVIKESDACHEFALVLWNDEKHTVDEVKEQVARACKKKKSYGEEKAREIDSVGRAIVEYSNDIPSLIQKAKILEQIKVTVTIRSSRDYFREEMCNTIVEWLTDISACSVGDDHDILTNTVCGEMLRQWQMGSNASNLPIGRQGYTDHQRTDERLKEMRDRDLYNRMLAARNQVRQAGRDVRHVTGVADRLNTVARRRHGNNATQEQVDDELDVVGEADENNTDDGGGFTIQALLQGMDDDDNIDPGGAFVATPQNDIITDTGELLATVSPFDLSQDTPRGPAESASQNSDDSEPDASILSPRNDPNELLAVATRPHSSTKTYTVPQYWLNTNGKSDDSDANRVLSTEENFKRRVRIDFLILYDLRMWKMLRNNLRQLYIGTVIKVPQFKRALGLRFAAIYRTLAQLYLVADREPDHSIINLSLQMLTTPSITEEIISRGNFCTRMFAILHTFLTKRKVGNPEDVDITLGMNFEAGVVANRRIHHLFNDLRYLLDAKYTHRRLREDPEYLLQFLDILQLFQGMDSNVRALNEHVPFETDAWMTTVMLVRDVARAVRLFANAFRWRKLGIEEETMYQDALPMCRAIKEIGRLAILHTLKAGHNQFQIKESRGSLHFKIVDPPAFALAIDKQVASPQQVVDFVLEREPMSFHHPLHWALSWIIDGGKSMAKAQLQSQLKFTAGALQSKDVSLPGDGDIPQLEPLQYLLALFDVPLQTLAWVAQLKAGMWVRNGLGLRHQMSAFRQVAQREVTSQRDLLLLQTAFVVCPPENFLANVIDRFHMTKLINGDPEIPSDWEDHHLMDMAEDFIHLLIVLVSDRTQLRPVEEDPHPSHSQAVHEIVHTLCFKPLAYSDIIDRVTHSTVTIPTFDQILASVAKYNPPQGLQDSGTFELKQEHFNNIDPYNYFFTKNQREEAENAWRRNEAQRAATPFDDIVFEPHLRPIRTGLFTDLSSFTQTPLFAQIIWGMLRLATHPSRIGKVPSSRVEAFLPLVLYLILIGIAEDPTHSENIEPAKSFVDAALVTQITDNGFYVTTNISILSELLVLKSMPNMHENSKAKIRRVLERLQERRPSLFSQAIKEQGLESHDRRADSSQEAAAREQAEKKRKAQERKAHVMASFKRQQNDFMSQQMHDVDLEDWDDLGGDVEMRDIGMRPLWNFPKDTCIFCQEGTDDQRLYGSLAYLSKSRIFRHTNLEDIDHLKEVGMTPLSYDRQTEHLRPFGIARSNIEHVKRVGENGEPTTHQRRGLGRGWTANQTGSGNIATSCGHLMHFSCFEAFNAATKRRQSFQIARNHPENLSLKEFVCPLCKALGNAFLPIIFKPKTLRSPSDLANVGRNFEDWLLSRAPFLASDSRVENDETYKHESIAYRNHAIQPAYAASVMPEPQTSSTRGHLAMPSFLGGSSNPSSLREQHGIQKSDALAAYERLKETIAANHLDTVHGGYWRTQSEPSPTDVLAGTLSWSVTATEIAARGSSLEPGGIFYLEKLPEQTVTHLRVLSETCSTSAAFVTMGGVHATKASVLAQRIQLLGPVSRGPQSLRDHRAVASMFEDDIFDFFTRTTIFLSPYLKLDHGEQHVMQLCLVAEMVKVVVAHLESFTAVDQYTQNDVRLRTDVQGAHVENEKISCSPEQSQTFSAFVQTIIHTLDASPDQPKALEFMERVERNPNNRARFDEFVRASVISYCLPFLRKCLLLMQVRACVDFSDAINLDVHAVEVDRLCSVLSLPGIDELISMCTGPDRVGIRIQELIHFWITHWRWRRDTSPKETTAQRPNRSSLQEQKDSILSDIFSPNSSGTFADTDLHIPAPPGAFIDDTPSQELDTSHRVGKEGVHPIRLSHPGVYELVALPESQDTLNAEALARRCPTTGGAISDPYLCLFCGEILCGQASCCAKEVAPGQTHGGCYQHQQRCGGIVGMFFNIRKSAVVFLHGRNGSFYSAPYLDEHGEIDFGLKRRARLFLEKRRYDRLFRDVWLGHGVPTAISRKLEGEVNTGGWETL